jgi:hypothetical protein
MRSAERGMKRKLEDGSQKTEVRSQNNTDNVFMSILASLGALRLSAVAIEIENEDETEDAWNSF